MMKYLAVVAFFIFLTTGLCFAQSENNKKGYVDSRGYEEGADYSRQSGAHKTKKNKKFLGIFGKKKSSPYNFDQKIVEYQELMEANAKKYKKMAKEMEKPQYSDPTYFGHKKKPKKRPPGKKKFCKECGMKH